MKHISLKKLALGEQKLSEAEAQIPQVTIDKKQFSDAVKKFKGFSNSIYRSNDLKNIVDEMRELIEQAESVTIKETDGWFDNITVNRHMKRLKESYKLFEKTAGEIGQLQQRLESCYEDIGGNLSKYWDME